MGSCDNMLELMSAALDGALTADEQAALEGHLSSCPACSALYEDLRGLRAATLELEEVPAPAGFSRRVMDAIAAAPAQEQPEPVIPFPAKRKARTPWKGWAAAAAVVAVIVGGISLAGPLGGTSADTASGGAAPAANGFSLPAQAPQAEDGGVAYSEDALTGADSGARVQADSDAAEHELDIFDTADAAPQPTPYPMEESAAAQPTSSKSGMVSDNADLSCGTIILTSGPLPEGLEEYEATVDDQGNLTYVVPADYFFSCLEALETEQPDSFTFDALAPESGAEYGLIVVSPFS